MYESNPECHKTSPAPGAINNLYGTVRLQAKRIPEKNHTCFLLLNFWASWRAPCLIEMPALQRLEAAFPDTVFTVLAVNVKEPREKAWRFQKILDVNFTMLLDTTGQAAENWNVAMYPTRDYGTITR